MPQRRHLVGLVAGIVLFVVLMASSAPAGMTLAAWRVVAVAGLMATWWITEAIPIAATALVPLVLFPLLDVSPIGDTAAPYANPVIFLFMGGFLIAAAWQRSGLHQRMALRIVALGGMRPRRLVGSFMVATAFISMWVSNTATTAMLLPMAVSIIDIAGAHDEEGRSFGTALLLGVAYSASIGGVGTLIGTPPNALLAGFMAEAYHRPIGFVEWMAVGIPVVLVALPICWFVLTRVSFRLGSEEIPGIREAVAARVRSIGVMTRTEWIVATVTIVTATLWLVRPLLAGVVPALSDAGIAIAGAIALFLLPGANQRRILDDDAIQGLPWPVLVLFGGGLALADGIQGTGLADWIGTSLHLIDTWPLVAAVLAVTAVTILMSELASNTATAAAFLPLVAALAIAMGIDPMMLAVPTALAATCAFMMPVGTPTNAMVYGTGRIALPQMLRAGVILNLAMTAVITIAAVVLVPLVFG